MGTVTKYIVRQPKFHQRMMMPFGSQKIILLGVSNEILSVYIIAYVSF